jgi:hypothetical protein
VEIAAAAVRREGVPRACACGAFARSLDFYAHVPTTVGVTPEDVVAFLDSPDRVVAAVDASLLEQVEAARTTRYPRLADLRYLDSGERQRPDLLVHPDRATMQHVVVISNR